jgi:hypothetical protein
MIPSEGGQIMNEFPQGNPGETSGGENVFLLEFVTTMTPATIETKLRPRYGMPDYRWRMKKPGEEGSSSGEGPQADVPE